MQSVLDYLVYGFCYENVPYNGSETEMEQSYTLIQNANICLTQTEWLPAIGLSNGEHSVQVQNVNLIQHGCGTSVAAVLHSGIRRR